MRHIYIPGKFEANRQPAQRQVQCLSKELPRLCRGHMVSCRIGCAQRSRDDMICVEIGPPQGNSTNDIYIYNITYLMILYKDDSAYTSRCSLIKKNRTIVTLLVGCRWLTMVMFYDSRPQAFMRRPWLIRGLWGKGPGRMRKVRYDCMICIPRAVHAQCCRSHIIWQQRNGPCKKISSPSY